MKNGLRHVVVGSMKTHFLMPLNEQREGAIQHFSIQEGKACPTLLGSAEYAGQNRRSGGKERELREKELWNSHFRLLFQYMSRRGHFIGVCVRFPYPDAQRYGVFRGCFIAERLCCYGYESDPRVPSRPSGASAQGGLRARSAPREAVCETFDVLHGREVILGDSLPENHFGTVCEAQIDASHDGYSSSDEFAVVGHSFVAQRI
jgi:hypothetical protein